MTHQMLLLYSTDHHCCSSLTKQGIVPKDGYTYPYTAVVMALKKAFKHTTILGCYYDTVGFILSSPFYKTFVRMGVKVTQFCYLFYI